jgi:hypothetical protein
MTKKKILMTAAFIMVAASEDFAFHAGVALSAYTRRTDH